MKRQDWETCNMVAQPVAFHPTQDPISSVDVCHALSGGSEHGKASAAVAQPVAFKSNGAKARSDAIYENISPTLNSDAGGNTTPRIATAMHVTSGVWFAIG
jgi:hypothetical protein